MTNLAPIALFVYARPRHTRQVLESLRDNELAAQSMLYIFADGPRNGVSRETLDNITAVREVIRAEQWCGTVHIVEAEENRGLAQSIISGVTRLVNEFGRVIVLEDDLLLHPDFLNFMNRALDKYADAEQVFAVTGYQFPFQFPGSVPDAFFFNDIASWTWATWKRAWDQFDPESKGWQQLQKDTDLRKRFNFDNTMDYATMLEQQMTGAIDSWAIRWYWTVFQNKGFSLFPKYSLVKNIGFDGTGEHCSDEQHAEDKLYAGRFQPQLPETVALDQTAARRIKSMWNLQNNHDIVTRIKRRLIKIFGTTS